MSAAADLFRQMADEIDAQKDGRFAGAVLCVPPSGDSLYILLSDPAQNPGNFWNLAKVRIELALGEVIEAERLANASPYGRMR